MAPRLCVAVGAERLLLKALPVEMPHWRLPVAIITVKNQLSPVAKLFIDCAREVANPLAKKLHTHSGG
jgi:DNA-binding transcriptional LysR family regulator